MIAATLKRSAKGAMTSADRRAPSEKLTSNKAANKMQFLNVLPSGVCRRSSMPVYRFRCPNYGPKLMKNG